MSINLSIYLCPNNHPVLSFRTDPIEVVLTTKIDWVVRPVDLDDYSDCTIAPVALDLGVWILTARLCYRPLTFPSV
jgi:hypothetical protein